MRKSQALLDKFANGSGELRLPAITFQRKGENKNGNKANGN